MYAECKKKNVFLLYKIERDDDMSIGENIRKFRKDKELTQEQIADMLGVSTPAVNKWENGNSMPDIGILAPLARTLDTDLNTLLDFREKLTEKEIAEIAEEISFLFMEGKYEAGIEKAEFYLKKYPGCHELCLQFGVLFMGIDTLPQKEEKRFRDRCRKKSEALFQYAAQSQDRKTADAAIYYRIIQSMNQGNYEQAEELLKQLPDTIVKKEEIYPGLYMRQKKYSEAKETLENMMYSKLLSAMTSMDMYINICMEQGEMERAEKISEYFYHLAEYVKISALNPYSAFLTVALKQKKKKETWEFLEKFIAYYMNEENYKMDNHVLFSQMKTKTDGESMQAMYIRILKNMLDSMENGEDSEYLREDKDYEERMNHLKEICGLKEK